VHLVLVRSNSCSSMMSSRRCRCWRRRRRRSGRIACWRAVRAGFIVSCSVLPTAGLRGGRSRRPCRALSMGRVRQVTTFCETATWAHRSSVAHLVSLHSSYSHRTPREGVRSPSGYLSLCHYPKTTPFPKIQGKQHQKTHPTNAHQASSIHGLVEPQYTA
jgi:hypothetical protein